MTGYVLVTLFAAAVAVVALTALALDRSARASAWRRIADERRWNHERVAGARVRPPGDVPTGTTPH